MTGLQFTLLSDGSSDQVLIPILRWLLGRHGIMGPIVSTWADLHGLLRQASGFHGHRLTKFPVRQRAHLVTELIRDFSPLLQLSAFQQLDADLRETVPALAGR